MNVSTRLTYPTLIPERTCGDTVATPNSVDNDDNDIVSQATPPSLVSTAAATTMKPTYYSLIEANTLLIVQAIKPFVKEITSEARRSINEYSLGPSIGHGQFGKVYKAYSNTTQSIVAIKLISKKPWNSQQYSMNQTMRQIQMWRSRGRVTPITGDEAVILMNVQKCRWELYVMSKLRNPYVTFFKECLDSPSSKGIWIVTEWCDLGELKWHRESQAKVLPQWQKVLPQCDVMSFARKALIDLTQGLHYLWSQGCIHRDIKPSNILVDGHSGLLKISDFGCSVMVPDSLSFDDESLVQCYQAELNKTVGTPAFIAPELCHFGESKEFNVSVENGFQLDIWSLGVTLYGIIQNSLPFYGDNEFDTYQKVVRNSLESKLNGEFLNDLVITRLLEKDPSKRIDIASLADIILPKESNHGTVLPTNKNGKQIQRLLNKFWKFKSRKKSRKETKKPAVVEVPPERQSYPSSDSSSTSSYEEPVQVTEFIDAGHLSNNYKESESNFSSEHQSSRSQDTKDSEKNDHLSILSMSPIKLATPIKALIRVKSSPNSDKIKKSNILSFSHSPSKDISKSNKPNGKRLAHSHDITNFQRYIQPNDQGRKPSKVGAPSTPEDIEEYLRYADSN